MDRHLYDARTTRADSNQHSFRITRKYYPLTPHYETPPPPSWFTLFWPIFTEYRTRHPEIYHLKSNTHSTIVQLQLPTPPHRTVGDQSPHHELTATPLYKNHGVQRLELIHHGGALPKTTKHYPTHQNPAYTTLRELTEVIHITAA
jgi:hypothetical protein